MRIDGTVIRQERTRRAWTQADLASRAGVDERTVQRLERSGQTSFATVQAIATAFDMEPARLIDGEPRTSSRAFTLEEPASSPAHRVFFWIFCVLAILGIVWVGIFDFGNSGNWPHWRIFFLASVTAVALLVYGYRRRDPRVFGIVSLAALISLLWYFPLTLPASVFLVATYLVLTIGTRRSASGDAERR